MKRFITRFLLVLFTPLTLYAVTFSIESGSTEKENSERYTILTISADAPFLCENLATPKKSKIIYQCHFEEVPMIKPEATRNAFFIVEPKIIRNKFYIDITPLYSSKLLPFFKTKIVPTPEKSEIWIITGFKKSQPFTSNKKVSGLKLPIEINFDHKLFVGSLDISKTPLMNKKRAADVNNFLSIQEKFKNGFYEEVIGEVDYIINEHNEFLFLPEVLTLKIQALNLIGNQEERILDTGLLWIKTYTAHKDMAQIMLLVAKAYLDMGIPSESMYFLDVLIEDYSETLYAKMAKIYKADRARTIGDSALALRLYKDVYFNSKDLNMASLAADRLADYYMQMQKPDLAMKYYSKIYEKNINFFMKDGIDKAIDYAYKFSYRKLEKMAAGVGDEILEAIFPNHPKYKEIVVQSARWHAESQNFIKAKEYYEVYLSKFSFEENIPLIKEEYEKLFLHQTDENSTEYIQKLDFLINDFPDEIIADQAFYEKTKFLFKEGNYSDVQKALPRFVGLDLSRFEDVKVLSETYIDHMMQSYLDTNSCKNAVDLDRDFNVTTKHNSLNTFYGCLDNIFAYDRADKVARLALENTLVENRKLWYERILSIAYNQGKDKKVAATAEEYLILLNSLGLKLELYYAKIILKSYKKLANDTEFIDYAMEYEKLFPSADNILDVYADLALAYERVNESRLSRAYIKKLYRAQEQQSTTLHSPWVDFKFASILEEEGDLQESARTYQKMLQKEISQEERARGLYLLSRVLESLDLKDISMQVLSRCSKMDVKSRYVTLCKEASRL
jgi:hypothetical protein